MPQAERAALRLSVRNVRRGAIALAIGLALITLEIIAAYTATSIASADGSLSSLTENPAVRALYGVPYDLDTGGGFTVWRAGMFIAVIAAIWAVMATTRVLRGEEESGRWELVLSGPLPRGRLTMVNGVVLGAASLLAGAAVAVSFITTGEDAGGAVLFGTGLVLLTLTFEAVGMLTSQLFGQRRRAAGIGGLIVGAAFLLRMAADGSDSAGWLRWATPFGWLEELQAFAGNRLLPLLPLVVAPVVVGAAALVLDARRDLGEGVVRDHDTAAPRLRLLQSPLRFAVRQRVGGFAGWAAGLVALGVVTGAITGAFVDFITSDPSIREATESFGDLASVGGFVATMDFFAAVVFALYVVSSIHLLWEDEESGRLDLVFATRVDRLRWLGSQVAVTATAAVVLTVAMAIAVWIGTAMGSASLSFGDSLIGTLNTLPLVALAIGFAVLVHGVQPRVVVPVVGGAVLVSYLLDLLGPAIDLADWVVDLSPFSHLAIAPAQPVAWTATAVMCAIALCAGALGAVAFSRRDLQ